MTSLARSLMAINDKKDDDEKADFLMREGAISKEKAEYVY